MEGDLLHCMNLKGTMGDAPICIDTVCNKSWVVSSGFPTQNNGEGDVSLGKPPPAIVAFLHLPILLTKVGFVPDSRTYADLTKSLDIILGTQAYWSFARTKV